MVSGGLMWQPGLCEIAFQQVFENEQSLEAFKKGLKTHLFKIAFVK
jgi:hypothetical protein